MSTQHHKSLLKKVFAETAKGNGRPFVEALSDEVVWTIKGTTPWSKKYVGKGAVLKDLLGPLSAQLSGANTITASRFIGEGDVVVVEGQGHNRTTKGKEYANTYCWVFRFQDEKVVELIEYTDTALIESALEAPSLQSIARIPRGDA
jgi:uncharacterized protein